MASFSWKFAWVFSLAWFGSMMKPYAVQFNSTTSQDAFTNSTIVCVLDNDMTEVDVSLDCIGDLEQDAIMYISGIFGGSRAANRCVQSSSIEECCSFDPLNQVCTSNYTAELTEFSRQFSGTSQADFQLKRPSMCDGLEEFNLVSSVVKVYYGCVSVGLLNDFAGNYTIESRSPVYLESNSFFDNSDIEENSTLQCLLVTDCSSTLTILAHYLIWFHDGDTECSETYYFQDAKKYLNREWRGCPQTDVVLNETILDTLSNAALVRMTMIGNHTGKVLIQATSSDPNGVVVISCGSEIFSDSGYLFTCPTNERTSSPTVATTKSEDNEFTTSEVSTDEFTTSEVSTQSGVSINSEFLCIQDDNSTEFEVSLDCNGILGMDAVMYFSQLYGGVHLLSRCNESSTYEDCCFSDPLEESCFDDVTITYFRDFAQLHSGTSQVDSQIDRPSTWCNNWLNANYPEYVSYIFFNYGCVSVGLLNDFAGNYTIERRSPVYLESNSFFNNSDIEESTLECLLVTNCGSTITIQANYLIWGPGLYGGQLEECFETYYFQDAKYPDMRDARTCPKWHIVLNETVLTTVSNAALVRMTMIINHTGKVLIQATSSDPSGVIVVSCGSEIVPNPDDDLLNCPSNDTTSSPTTAPTQAASDETNTYTVTPLEVNTGESTIAYFKTDMVTTSALSTGSVTADDFRTTEISTDNITTIVFNATHSPLEGETDPSNNCCGKSIGIIMGIVLVLQLFC